MRSLIIWLFERYCFDEWIEKQNRESKEQIMKDNNLSNDDEFFEFMIDTDPQRNACEAAYSAGRTDGYAKAMKEAE